MKYDYKEIGKRLREKRISLKIELKDIIEEIKIFEEYLIAIEEGELQNLPSDIYYNLFVRTYAKELGMDIEKLLDDTYLGGGYSEDESKEKKNDEPVNNIETSSSTYTSPKKIFGWIAILALVVFLIYIVFTSLTGDNEGEEPTKTSSIVEEVTPKINEETSLVIDTVKEISSDIERTVADTTTNSIPIASPPLTLDIEVKELSWILIMADGDTVLHRNLRPADTRHLTANDNFNLSVGNPNGVVLKLNNRLMRPLSRNGRVVTNLLITQGNKENYFSVEENRNE